MADLFITIDPDELLGLRAIAELSKPPEGIADGLAGSDSSGADLSGPDLSGADLSSTARALLNQGLAARLDELGLSWAPSAEVVHSHMQAAAGSSARGGFLHRMRTDLRVRKYGATVLLVVLLIALWGGYGLHWQWTGFAANDQLWDWMHLLILPVALGTLPLWIQNSGYISSARRAAYLSVIVVFGIFVAVGYLAPWKWTGFQGNTLWDWFELLLLPVGLVSLRAWSAAGRSVRPWHRASFAAVLAGWLVTLVGGYSANWHWTGYQGNTLWDWLQLLLLPLLFPTVLLPAMLKWVTGNAAGRAQEDARKARETPPGTASVVKA